MKRHIDDKTKKDGGAENSVWVLQDSYLNGINSVAEKMDIIASALDQDSTGIYGKKSKKEVIVQNGVYLNKVM